jgi:NTE family protein
MFRSASSNRPLVAALVASLSACSVFPYDHGTRANEPFAAQAAATRGSERISFTELAEPKVFVGIAMSGGGSRAANFSAAALLELERLGLLQHATAISSVSGGSLAAAYYGLYGADPQRWNATRIREVMRKDLQTAWVWRWFLPQNIARFWFTPFDRSDIMKGVIDDELFDGRMVQYTAMNNATRLPRILINASDLTGGNFVFTDEAFRERLSSRLDLYPVAHAVMGSAAFPGVFNNLTLENYASAGRRSYLHLIDAGPTDNLGVKALRRTLASLDGPRGARPVRGCMMIVVDSYPDILGTSPGGIADHDKRHEDDPRAFLDFFFDTNLDDAFGNLLSSHREEMLKFMGYPEERVGLRSFWTYRPFRDSDGSANRSLECHVWHLTFQTLARLEPGVPGAKSLGETVNGIKTQFRLRSAAEGGVNLQQQALFDAAQMLVRQDAAALAEAQRLMREWGMLR